MRLYARPHTEHVLTDSAAHGEALGRGLALLKRKRGFAVFTRHVHERRRAYHYLKGTGNLDCGANAPAAAVYNVRA